MSKPYILTVFGAVGSFLAGLLGGWTSALTTLLIFMAIDYGTGIIVAAVFHKSPKSDTGRAESIACFKGLLRKGMILLIVLVAYRLDLTIGSGSLIKDGVCIAFIVNEAISIIENAGLMGITIPSALSNAIDVLQKKSDEESKKVGGEDG